MLQLNSASKNHDHFDLPKFKKNILYESLASISRTSDYSSYLKGSLQSVSRCEYSLDDFGASSVTGKSSFSVLYDPVINISEHAKTLEKQVKSRIQVGSYKGEYPQIGDIICNSSHAQAWSSSVEEVATF